MISLDYAFRHEGEEEDGIAPVLVALDRAKTSIWTLEVDAKGVDSGVGIDWLIGRLNLSGYAGVNITVRTDQEPPLLAFKEALAVKRKAETSFIESPVRE